LLSAVPDVVTALGAHHKVAGVALAGLRFLFFLASNDFVDLGAVSSAGPRHTLLFWM
jgi:hypothetical protein